jgi:hypothetical protein
MGQELGRLEKATGTRGQLVGRGVIGGDMTLPPITEQAAPRPRLADIGISKAQSSRWQAVAAIPEEMFERYIAESEKASGEISTAGLMRFAKRQQNGAQGASSSGTAQAAESEEPAANIDEAACGADIVCGPNNGTPVTTAPAALQEGVGRPPGDGEAVPKSRHAPANDAVASDKRVEGALDRLAALSPQERALVIEAAVDRWPPIEERAAEEDDDVGPSPHDQCINLAALKSGWDDVVVAMAVTRLIGTAFYAPDAPKLPAPDEASELLVTLTEWVDRLRGPIEAQQVHNSAIAVDGVANVEIEGSETAAAGINDGNDAAGLEQIRGSATTEPGDAASVCRAKEPSETPEPHEHDNGGADDRVWPSREVWAKNRRTVDGDNLNDEDLGISGRVADYASPEEIVELRSTLRKVSRKTKKYARHWLREALEDLCNGHMPIDRGLDVPLLAEILGRYQRARDAAEAELRRSVEALPIDDDAWGEELERRRNIERGPQIEFFRLCSPDRDREQA